MNEREETNVEYRVFLRACMSPPPPPSSSRREYEPPVFHYFLSWVFQEPKAFLKALLRVIFIWEVGDERGRRGTRIPHPPPPRVRRVRTQGFHIRPGVGVWAKPYAVLAALGCLLPRSFCMF
ncbi:unnamed protein product [Ectocarpus fasciculatus]